MGARQKSVWKPRLYERAMYFDVAKHIYDVGVMLNLQPIQDMLGNTGLFLEMSGYKRLEETRRTGSDLADKKFSDFGVFRGLADSMGIREAYQNMQRNYVFSEKDLLSFEFVTSQWKKLYDILSDMERI